MRKYSYKVTPALWLVVLIGLLCTVTPQKPALGQSPFAHGPTAQIQSSPPQIKLVWPSMCGTDISISRRDTYSSSLAEALFIFGDLAAPSPGHLNCDGHGWQTPRADPTTTFRYGEEVEQ